MRFRLLALVSVAAFAACDSNEPDLPTRGQFEATVRGDLTRDLEGDATTVRLPGLDETAFVSVSLMGRPQDGAFGRSVSVSGVITAPGDYPLSETGLNAVRLNYADGLRDFESAWFAASGTLSVDRYDSDGIDGSIEAVLERIDSRTARVVGRAVLEADFEAIPLSLETSYTPRR